MRFYVEIRKAETEEVVKRMGPMGEREAERVERGANINLNHEAYYTALVEAEEVKPNERVDGR